MYTGDCVWVLFPWGYCSEAMSNKRGGLNMKMARKTARQILMNPFVTLPVKTHGTP